MYHHIRCQDQQGSRVCWKCRLPRQTRLLADSTKEYGTNNKHLKKGTKISVYQAIILTTLLYGSESWVTCCHHLRLLEHFHQHCLCTILNIHKSNYVSHLEVLDQVKITAMMGRACLQNGGRHRLAKIALYGELSTGYHDRGAPKKCFKASLKKTLCTCHIDHHQWSTFADCQTWRHAEPSQPISIPAVNMDSLLHKSSFMKSSRERERERLDTIYLCANKLLNRN